MELKFENKNIDIDSKCKEFVGVFEHKPGKYYCRYKLVCKNYNELVCYLDIDKVINKIK